MRLLIGLSCCRVIDGFEVLDDLEKVPVQEQSYRPLHDVTVKSVTVHANPFADGSID